MDKSKVLAFGEVLWDFIEGDKHFGGAPVNFAAHLVQCGRAAGIVTALGDDKLGDQALEQIIALGLDSSFVQRNHHLTGRVMVFLENGQPTYRIRKDVAYDFIEQLTNLDGVRQYDAFYFGTLAQRNPKSREALHQILENVSFSTIYYDVNLRRDSYSREVLEHSFSRCTIAKMNNDEVIEISKLFGKGASSPADFIQWLLKENRRLELVIVTSGGEGCYLHSLADVEHIPAKSAVVKDSVGAGDAFSAAFLDTYLRTKDAKKAAKIGNMVGGFVVSERGAIPIYPEQFRREIEILSAG